MRQGGGRPYHALHRDEPCDPEPSPRRHAYRLRRAGHRGRVRDAARRGERRALPPDECRVDRRRKDVPDQPDIGIRIAPGAALLRSSRRLAESVGHPTVRPRAQRDRRGDPQQSPLATRWRDRNRRPATPRPAPPAGHRDGTGDDRPDLARGPLSIEGPVDARDRGGHRRLRPPLRLPVRGHQQRQPRNAPRGPGDLPRRLAGRPPARSNTGADRLGRRLPEPSWVPRSWPRSLPSSSGPVSFSPCSSSRAARASGWCCSR